MNQIQVKICGITTPESAKKCVELGADAIGVVFFPKSPRNVSTETAKKIASAVNGKAAVTGVFVNETFDFIMERVDSCLLDAVQLHGNESPDFIQRLKESVKDRGIKVIKCLYLESDPNVSFSATYNADSFLIECAKGVLPGGNAMDWNFKRAGNLNIKKPVMIAGGLSPDNIIEAISSALPDAVDVSSGVEEMPGQKSPEKVEAFINAVKNYKTNIKIRSVF
jgi:phosphoribosylanthranilate isomerase